MVWTWIYSILTIASIKIDSSLYTSQFLPVTLNTDVADRLILGAPSVPYCRNLNQTYIESLFPNSSSSFPSTESAE